MKTITIEVPDEMASLGGGSTRSWAKRCDWQRPFYGTNRAGSHRGKQRKSLE